MKLTVEKVVKNQDTWVALTEVMQVVLRTNKVEDFLSDMEWFFPKGSTKRDVIDTFLKYGRGGSHIWVADKVTNDRLLVAYD